MPRCFPCRTLPYASSALVLGISLLLGSPSALADDQNSTATTPRSNTETPPTRPGTAGMTVDINPFSPHSPDPRIGMAHVAQEVRSPQPPCIT